MKLSDKDCVALIDNIRDRLHNWYRRHLSYAGRLELIKYVLLNITNFWCKQLILPQSVLSRIEQLCSRFFWKGSDKSATGARVSWEKLCLLKTEGGLGLKDIKSWNNACMMHLIRNLLAGEGSLWIVWIKNYAIKDFDFWNMNDSINTTWSFRRLLRMRLQAFHVLTYGVQKIKDIWLLIRNKGAKVAWHKLIWFPLHIPKFSIIAWMALLDRLPTKDKLKRFGFDIDDKCVLCNDSMEIRDHLFIQCPLAISLWDAVIILNGMRRTSRTWENHLAWACDAWKGRSLLTAILKLAWTTFIYTVERRGTRGYSRDAHRILKHYSML